MLHAAPLLALAGLYGLVTVLLAVSLLRERRSATLVVGICLLFALVAVGSAALAALTLAGRDPIAAEPFWLVLAGSAALAVPGVIVLVRGHDRALLATARRRVSEAEDIATERTREAGAISRLSSALSSARTGEEAA